MLGDNVCTSYPILGRPKDQFGTSPTIFVQVTLKSIILNGNLKFFKKKLAFSAISRICALYYLMGYGF